MASPGFPRRQPIILAIFFPELHEFVKRDRGHMPNAPPPLSANAGSFL